MSTDNSSTPSSQEEVERKVEELLEVRPVEPIKLDTVGYVEPIGPETRQEEPPAPKLTDMLRRKPKTDKELLTELRLELAKVATEKAVVEEALHNTAVERDNARGRAAGLEESVISLRKRQSELAGDRDRWKTRAEKAEKLHDTIAAGSVSKTLEENARLRAQLGAKDKEIAALTKRADAAQTQAEASRRLSLQAEGRAQGMEASVEAMQRARDKAQRELADAEGILREIKLVLQVLGVDVEKTPPMYYPEAIKAQYLKWTKRVDALETQVESLIEKLPKPAAAAAPAPARKGA